MKKIICPFFLSVMLMMEIFRPAFAAPEPPPEQGRHLIVYYSLSGHTRTIAEFIHQAIGGDMVEIKTVQPYPTQFEAVVQQARQERQNNFLPPIAPLDIDWDSYDTIYLGFPIWGNTIPQPVATFLSQNRFVGKTIIPFSTHDGYGVGHSYQAVQGYCPDAILLEGFEMHGAQAQLGQQRVAQWLEKLRQMSITGIESMNKSAQIPITITVENIELQGLLEQSPETQAFIDMMPITISMVGYGGREYYGALSQRIHAKRDGQLYFSDGDITYCPQNNTIAIFFAQTSRPHLTMRVIPLGKVTSDLSVFQKIGSSVQVNFRLRG